MTTATITPETIIADIYAAIERLRLHGWGQGQFWDPDTGRLCLVGAFVTGIYGAVPAVPGIADKPMWKPSQLLTDDQKARAKAAENAATGYIRRQGLLNDVANAPEQDRDYDTVDWNDHNCGSVDGAIALLLAVIGDLAVTS